jgi:heme A synthase
VNVFNVVLGGVVVSLGLTFWWALIAITAGTIIGALLIALHATQGPRLGVPQSIQSRGQFGFYGAAFMFSAVLLLTPGTPISTLPSRTARSSGARSRRTCSSRITRYTWALLTEASSGCQLTTESVAECDVFCSLRFEM